MLSGLGYLLFAAPSKDNLLIGQATHGHHQIELACEACHTSSFGGPEILQNACTGCHQQELDAVHDSHPRKKFTDPRNAELAERLDATMCVTCHAEHQLEQTRDMGVTVAEDVCFHCHEAVGEHRESHEGLSFDTCATSGCHNFHDNRALYESFLVKNAGKPWVDYEAVLLLANSARFLSAKGSSGMYEKNDHHDYAQIKSDWSESSHAGAAVTCVDCHQAAGEAWVEQPGVQACESCHADETYGFVSGKHGMRLAPAIKEQLEPMSPKLARLDFKDSAHDHQLTCSSCHDSHKPNLQKAAVESCLGCHADQHSLAYQTSPHARLWQAELDQVAPENTGVTCASCHMPTIEHKQIVDKETRLRKVSIEHNQSATLRPNEKMIRPVCMQCHSLEFSIDALADEALILNNFNGKPSKHVESVDWALKRETR